MKNKVISSILIILIFIVNTLVAQESVTRKLDDFYSLKATGDMRVEIFPSDKTYAEVFYAGTTPEKVITEVKNFELNIRLRTDTPKDAKIRIVLYYSRVEREG